MAANSVLWNFGSGTDGAFPGGGLITDKQGNLYGTTAIGGAYGRGTVFKLTPPSTDGDNWTEAILWNFNPNGTDGFSPRAGVIMDRRGNLYGTTQLGGAKDGSSSGGTVFKLSPPAPVGGSFRTESILWNFGGYSTDGAEPETSLITDEEGNLYGTTTATALTRRFCPLLRRDGVQVEPTRNNRRQLDRVDPLELWQRQRWQYALCRSNQGQERESLRHDLFWPGSPAAAASRDTLDTRSPTCDPSANRGNLLKSTPPDSVSNIQRCRENQSSRRAPVHRSAENPASSPEAFQTECSD